MGSAAQAASDDFPPRATEVTHAWLRAPLYRELEAEAGRRREHVDAYTAKLLTAVVVLGVGDELMEQAKKLLDC